MHGPSHDSVGDQRRAKRRFRRRFTRGLNVERGSAAKAARRRFGETADHRRSAIGSARRRIGLHARSAAASRRAAASLRIVVGHRCGATQFQHGIVDRQSRCGHSAISGTASSWRRRLRPVTSRLGANDRVVGNAASSWRRRLRPAALLHVSTGGGRCFDRTRRGPGVTAGIVGLRRRRRASSLSSNARDPLARSDRTRRSSAASGRPTTSCPQPASMALTCESIRSQIRPSAPISRNRQAISRITRAPLRTGARCFLQRETVERRRSRGSGLVDRAPDRGQRLREPAVGRPAVSARQGFLRSAPPRRAPCGCRRCGCAWHIRRETSGPARSP